MKKLSVAVLVLSLMLPVVKAEAHPWAICAVAGSASSSTILFTGGMAAFATLPILIVELQPYHVWNHVFPVVDETFPSQAKSGLGVPQKVAYNYASPVVANSSKFTYKDELGTHKVK